MILLLTFRKYLQNAKIAQVIWTNTTLLEFNEITEYIALDKPDVATKLVKKIFNQVYVMHIMHCYSTLKVHTQHC